MTRARTTLDDGGLKEVVIAHDGENLMNFCTSEAIKLIQCD